MEKTLKVLNGPVRALTFLNDNGIVTGSNNGMLNLWNLQTQSLKVRYEGHSGKILQTKRYILTEVTTFISSEEDGNVILWNKDNGEVVRGVNVDQALNSGTSRDSM